MLVEDQGERLLLSEGKALAADCKKRLPCSDVGEQRWRGGGLQDCWGWGGLDFTGINLIPVFPGYFIAFPGSTQSELLVRSCIPSLWNTLSGWSSLPFSLSLSLMFPVCSWLTSMSKTDGFQSLLTAALRSRFFLYQTQALPVVCLVRRDLYFRSTEFLK